MYLSRGDLNGLCWMSLASPLVAAAVAQSLRVHALGAGGVVSGAFWMVRAMPVLAPLVST